MIIKKFQHSCILVEENGKKLLIDPGSFTFIDRLLNPDDIGPVDGLLITHAHPDHYDMDAIKEFMKMRKMEIVTNDTMSEGLKLAGIEHRRMEPEEKTTVAGFKIRAIKAPHGTFPGVTVYPTNYAYVVNDTLLHPGDSFQVPQVDVKAVCVPTGGPWLKMQEYIDFAKAMKPKVAIPIHDGMFKDFAVEFPYNTAKQVLAKEGIEFKPLKLRETLEIK